MQLILPGTFADPLRRSQSLEEGNILFFPQAPFDFSGENRDSLLAAVQTSSDLHKNISYRPKQDKVSGLGKAQAGVTQKVTASLRHFSAAATRFAAELLPHYAAAWRLDYASFRGIEEQGRDLAWKKRNDLLHTDAFPTRPTNGDLILRFFLNINPTRERVWVTTDPFGVTAAQYANRAGLQKIATTSSAVSPWKRVASALGLPVPVRSRYDEFMLGFHDYLKANEGFQRESRKYQFQFPPNSAWMVFTDVVPHAVISGQFAVEQTFIVSKDSLAAPELAPVRVLERLSGNTLTR